MIRFPSAKINLGLRIGPLRSDKYHEIETLLYPIPWYDLLEWVPSTKFALEVTGHALRRPQGGALEPRSNLVYRAYKLISEAYKLPPLSVHLHKVIPSGAGLGGGSSDAAEMLLSLNEAFSLGATEADLHSYALQLGSDVPFFLHQGPHLAKGRGDELISFASILKGLYIRVLVPQIHIDTATAYATLGPRRFEGPSLADRLLAPRARWSQLLKNDFQPQLLGKYPLLSELEGALLKAGALYVSLSGSGSAVYGLFEAPPTAPPPTGVASLTSTL